MQKIQWISFQKIATLLDKIFGTRYRKHTKLERIRKLWYLLHNYMLWHNFWVLFQSFYFWKRGWVLEFMCIQFSHFPNICYFPEILIIKLFYNLWGNSYIVFVILRIRYWFNGGKWKLFLKCYKISKQYVMSMIAAG